MQRRGQVFLILTILVVTFLVGITTVLLDIRRADYLVPSPDAEATLNSWNTALDGIEKIFEIQISQNSSAGSPSGTTDITAALQNLESYLNQKGFSAVIENSSLINYDVQGDGTTNTTISLQGTIFIFIKSGNTEISQSIDVLLLYNADAPVANTLILRRLFNSQISFIQGAVFSNPAVVDMANGMYDTSGTGGGALTVTLPTTAILNVLAI